VEALRLILILMLTVSTGMQEVFQKAPVVGMGRLIAIGKPLQVAIPVRRATAIARVRLLGMFLLAAKWTLQSSKLVLLCEQSYASASVRSPVSFDIAANFMGRAVGSGHRLANLVVAHLHHSIACVLRLEIVVGGAAFCPCVADVEIALSLRHRLNQFHGKSVGSGQFAKIAPHFPLSGLPMPSFPSRCRCDAKQL